MISESIAENCFLLLGQLGSVVHTFAKDLTELSRLPLCSWMRAQVWVGDREVEGGRWLRGKGSSWLFSFLNSVWWKLCILWLWGLSRASENIFWSDSFFFPKGKLLFLNYKSNTCSLKKKIHSKVLKEVDAVHYSVTMCCTGTQNHTCHTQKWDQSIIGTSWEHAQWFSLTLGTS